MKTFDMSLQADRVRLGDLIDQLDEQGTDNRKVTVVYNDFTREPATFDLNDPADRTTLADQLDELDTQALNAVRAEHGAQTFEQPQKIARLYDAANENDRMKLRGICSQWEKEIGAVSLGYDLVDVRYADRTQRYALSSAQDRSALLRDLAAVSEKKEPPKRMIQVEMSVSILIPEDASNLFIERDALIQVTAASGGVTTTRKVVLNGTNGAGALLVKALTDFQDLLAQAQTARQAREDWQKLRGFMPSRWR